MQDSEQCSARPETKGAAPETSSDSAQVEEVYRLMQSLLDMTRAAAMKAVEGDPVVLREFLMRREAILEKLQKLSDEKGSAPGSPLRQRQFKNNFALMMQTIMAENSRVVQLIRERKKAVLGKIAEAQNRRQVFKYTK